MSNKARQELYDRIRESSKDSVIVDEMERLGFWPDPSQPDTRGLPDDPAAEIRRIGELQRLLNQLAGQAGALQNTEKARLELRRRRMAESRSKREQTRQRRIQDVERRAKGWEQRKKTELLYLGEDGVSTSLSEDSKGAPRHGLPRFEDALGLAGELDLTLGELRWLAFHRRVSETTHYRRFTIPKKTGGVRNISAPMPRLKAVQARIAMDVLGKVPLHDAAHGFVPGRSIVTNAQAHVGQPVVINMDLRNFFPTITWKRVQGLFRKLGYGGQVSTILALLLTEPDVVEAELDGRTWYVHTSERHLPQGSPASPVLTNVLCYRLDKRLSGLAGKWGFTYTRYADDLTFSGPQVDRVGALLGAVRRVVADEGFEVHPDKTRVMHKGRRQEVTGLVVNEAVGVPRPVLRRFRAVLHKLEESGPDSLEWGHSGDLFASLMGFAAFVTMVDLARGEALLARVGGLAAKHGWKRPKRRVYEKKPPAWKDRGRYPDATLKVELDEVPTEVDITELDPTEAMETEVMDQDKGTTKAPSGASKKWWEFWK